MNQQSLNSRRLVSGRLVRHAFMLTVGPKHETAARGEQDQHQQHHRQLHIDHETNATDDFDAQNCNADIGQTPRPFLL